MHHYQEQRWRFDKRVPLALLFMVVAQLVTLVAWATYLEARVSALESGSNDARQVVERLGRLEERIDAVRGDIALLRQALDRRR